MSFFVAAAGARTPVGLELDPTAAAVRAGISRLGNHPKWVDKTGENMMAAMDGAMPHNERVVARMETLGRSALGQVVGPLRESLRVGLYVALPEFRPGWTDADVRTLVPKFVASLEGHGKLERVQPFPRGHAAGYLALATAMRDLAEPRIDAAVVLGVDSYFSPLTMEWLDDSRQLQNYENRIGFIPGEAGAALVVARGNMLRQLQVRGDAEVLGVGTATESALIKTDDPCVGIGLAEAMRQATATLQLPAQKISHTLCDINGEGYRSKEFMYIPLRIEAPFVDANRYVAPADCMGDVGAASGPLHIGLCCAAARRGHPVGPYSMTWASSEGGLRGASALRINESAS